MKFSSIRKIFLTVVFLLAGFEKVLGDESAIPTPTPGGPAAAPTSQVTAEATGTTLNAKANGIHLLPVPIVNYQDPYGFVGGAALLLAEPKTESRLQAGVLTNFNQYFITFLNLEWRRPGNWVFDANGTFGNDLQDYFGEGDHSPDIYQQLTSNLDEFSTSFQFELVPQLYLGPSLQYLYRNWTNTTFFPRESEGRVGIQSTLDTRDNTLEPRQGFYFRLGIYALPSAGNSGWSTGVWQFEGDARNYQKVFDPMVMVSRINAGWSEGDPGYSFRYSLGGMYELRGYDANRFRGSRFFILQEEARIPLFGPKSMEVALSVDAGDVSDEGFSSLLGSYQVGLRSKPLSDLGLLLCLDVGWGFKNEGGQVWLNTSEPF